jgi:hypothetical protein
VAQISAKLTTRPYIDSEKQPRNSDKRGPKQGGNKPESGPKEAGNKPETKRKEQRRKAATTRTGSAATGPVR